MLFCPDMNEQMGGTEVPMRRPLVPGAMPVLVFRPV